MSKLDDYIREHGCSELDALAWLKERRAEVAFHRDHVTVCVPHYGPMVNSALPVLRDRMCGARSLVGAVIEWVKQYGGK